MILCYRCRHEYTPRFGCDLFEHFASMLMNGRASDEVVCYYKSAECYLTDLKIVDGIWTLQISEIGERKFHVQELVQKMVDSIDEKVKGHYLNVEFTNKNNRVMNLGVMIAGTNRNGKFFVILIGDGE